MEAEWISETDVRFNQIIRRDIKDGTLQLNFSYSRILQKDIGVIVEL
jgi:hypothetical protein